MSIWKRRLAIALGAALIGSATSAGAQTITMWHIFGQPTEPGLQNIKRWNDTHPGAQIDHKFIPFGQLSQQLIKGIASGDVPDLITIVEQDTCRAITTERLRYGVRVRVLAMPADDRWVSEPGLEMARPRHFGYDADYRPFVGRRPAKPVSF